MITIRTTKQLSLNIHPPSTVPSSQNFQTSARLEESKDADHHRLRPGAGTIVLELGEFDSRDSVGAARSARDDGIVG